MSAASSEHAPRAQVNRRAFLRTVGASAAGVVAATAGNPVRPIAAQTEGRGEGQGTPAGRFGRMFPQLRPFAANSPALQAALMDLGKPGGILDAKDDLSKGPVLLITDLSLRAHGNRHYLSRRVVGRVGQR